MDWTNERYVRVYVRDTADLLAVGWQGRQVLWEMMRKADRAGIVDGDKETLPDLLRMPPEVVEPGIAALIRRNVVVRGQLEGSPAYLIRNFLPAQEAKQSDAQRQRESRARRRDAMRRSAALVTKRDEHSGQPVTFRDETVTRCHTASQAVTPSLAVPNQPSRAESRAGARVATTAPPLRTTEEARHAVVCDGCDEAIECPPSEEPPGWEDGLCPECQRHETVQGAKPAGQTAGYLQDIKAQGAACRAPALGTEPMNPVARQIAEHIRTHRRFDAIDAGEIGNSTSNLVETGGKSLSWLRAAIDECNRDAGSAAAARRPWEPELLAQKLGRYLWKARRPEAAVEDEETEVSRQHPPLFRDDGPRPDPEDTKRWAREAAEKLKNLCVGKRMPAE